MNKSTKKPVVSKKKDTLNSYSELVEITEGMRDSAHQIIAANAKVIVELPGILNDMKEKDVKDKEVEQVLAVARTIAKDTDSFSNELKEIDEKFTDIKKKGTSNIRVAVKHYTSVLALSTRYCDINTRLTETTSELVDDFTDLCLEVTGQSSEDGSTEETVKDGE